MSDEVELERGEWWQAWPDALAFAAGLSLAWFNEWQTKDLVWSLWLSSLVVGYAMIVWDIFGPGRLTLQGTDASLANPAAVGALLLVGRLFMLGFFTVHFGGFHFVHSMFLNSFFPVFPGLHTSMFKVYAQVVADYWPFVLVAAVAERKAFLTTPARVKAEATSDPAQVGTTAANKPRLAGADMLAPYKNVVRLHLLIFFFAFASIKHLDGFAVYAVVYAVYFFPWRLLRRR